MLVCSKYYGVSGRYSLLSADCGSCFLSLLHLRTMKNRVTITSPQKPSLMATIGGILLGLGVLAVIFQIIGFLARVIIYFLPALILLVVGSVLLRGKK